MESSGAASGNDPQPPGPDHTSAPPPPSADLGTISGIESLLKKYILAMPVVKSGSITVAFTPPMPPDFTPDATHNKVSVYLYDLREDLERRNAGAFCSNDWPTRMTVRQEVPRYLELSYMVTAWMGDPSSAHDVLGEIFHTLTATGPDSPYRVLGQAGVLLDVGRPPVQDQILTDLWTTFKNPLTPFLNLSVSMPTPLHAPVKTPMTQAVSTAMERPWTTPGPPPPLVRPDSEE
ncbi:Pvc16 family protein [Streptomyces sp. MNP-20]|uniref:Pvc16 family protein n=1 Tax=Streptomyces sp. MNP-20 TaxID=2721165 RepID=UPI0015535C42|nr:Pvc16 family protein [Streptomyces sp. MNP-20]